MSSITIQKCFRKAGILDNNYLVIKRASALQPDPFEDLDEESDTTDLQALITQVQNENACSVEEFVSGDQDLQTSVNIYGDNWSEEFLNSLPGPSSDSDNVPTDDMELVEEQQEEDSRESELKCFREALQYMEDVLCYLDHRGCTTEANQASQLLDSINYLCIQSKSLKQTHVTDYFK